MADDDGALTRLQERLAQRERHLEAIHHITTALGSVTELTEVVREALRVSLDCVGARDGSVALHDPERHKLIYTHAVGAKADQIIGLELGDDEGLAGAVRRSGELRVSQDFQQDEDRSRVVEERFNYLVHNQVTVPLKSPRGATIGVMQVLNKDAGDFDEADAEVLDILGAQVAIAIESARLYEQARVAEIVRYIGNLSHDVKNMITPAQTGAETLRMVADDCYERLSSLLTPEHCPDAPLDEVWEALDGLRGLYPEMLDMITDGADAVQQRMKEISDAVKGVVSAPVFERQQLGPIAERVVKALHLVGDRSGVAVSYVPETDLPDLELDQGRMYNAIYNLVHNAIQATPPGGSVTVRTRLGDEQSCPDWPCAVLEVTDTGSGVAPEVLADLFTDRVRTTKSGGTGLGTRIVKSVMDVHGARLQVESKLGEGTTVRCLVPLSQPPNGG